MIKADYCILDQEKILLPYIKFKSLIRLFTRKNGQHLVLFLRDF